MAVSLRRVYLSLAIAGALSARALALARALHPLLWMLEAPDATEWSHLHSGEPVAVPMFGNAGTPPPGQQVLDALPQLPLTLAVTAPDVQRPSGVGATQHPRRCRRWATLRSACRTPS